MLFVVLIRKFQAKEPKLLLSPLLFFHSFVKYSHSTLASFKNISIISFSSLRRKKTEWFYFCLNLYLFTILCLVHMFLTFWAIYWSILYISQKKKKSDTRNTASFLDSLVFCLAFFFFSAFRPPRCKHTDQWKLYSSFCFLSRLCCV